MEGVFGKLESITDSTALEGRRTCLVFAAESGRYRVPADCDFVVGASCSRHSAARSRRYGCDGLGRPSYVSCFPAESGRYRVPADCDFVAGASCSRHSAAGSGRY
jgi:hypothetical protein